MTSTEIQDTDGDTLKDGEEIIIYKEYIPIKNKVLVRAMMLSDSRTRDTDGDGISDTIDARPLKNDILRIGLANDYVSIYGHPGVPRFLEDIYYNQYTPSYGGCQNWFNYTNFQITHPNREIRDYINIAKNGCTFIAASDFLLYMLKYHPEIDSAHNYSNKLGNINYLDFNTYMEELLFWEKFLHVSEYPLNSTQLQNGLNFLFMNYDIDLLCSSSITEFFSINTIIDQLDKNIPVIFSIRFKPYISNKSITFYDENVVSAKTLDWDGNKILENENHTVIVTGIVYDANITWLEVSSWGKKYYINLSDFNEKCLNINNILHFSGSF